MPRSQKSLSKQSQWTVILVGGLAFIYIGMHWYNFLPVKSVVSDSVSSAVLTSNAQRLEIPALDIKAPIVYSTSIKESAIQVELESGIVHLSGTAIPGDVGNAFIVGHSSNYKNAPGVFNEVFAKLPNIQVGDEIDVVENKETLKFEVYATRVVEPTELWVMSQETSGDKILTLQTSYPVGTSKMRFIAQARLKR